jgi:hypothetical protein
MYVESALISKSGNLTARYSSWFANAELTRILPLTVETGLFSSVVSTPTVNV